MTDTVPQYAAGTHSALDPDEALAIMDRLFAHLANNSTDMAAEQLEIPMSYYLDEQLWQQELQEIFWPLEIRSS